MGIALHALRTIAFAITNPASVIVLIVLSIVFYRQNKKTAVMQRMILGERKSSPLELTISQIVVGILAGALASIMLSYLGIVFDESSAIDLIFLISILLMLWNPRFICFAYSGALLGLLSTLMAELSNIYSGKMINIFGTIVKIGNLDILKIDVVSLMALIGVLHFVEGIMIMFDGTKGAIPVFTNKNNRIIGGFALKRNWIIPVALIFATQNINSQVMGEQVPLSQFHSIIRTTLSPQFINASLLFMISFYGVIGYNSVTFTKSKEKKAFISGISIMLYGIVLLIICPLARLGLFYKVLVLTFAPFAHELILRLQRYIEVTGTPKYISGEDGIMVLEIAPNSPAFEMGIKSGDVLVEVNSKKVVNEEDILKSLQNLSTFLWLKVKRADGQIEELTYSKLSGDKRLGIVFVPRGIPKDSMVVKINESKFGEILDKLKNKDKDE